MTRGRSRTARRAPTLALAAALAAVVVGTAGFLGWALTPLGPTPSALEALQGDERVEVTRTAEGYEFAPAGIEPTSALIFYPGGRVDVRSYAPFARDIAAAGHLVVVPAMPLSLAVFDIDAAERIRSSHPAIETWVLGGHSLGGAMAATHLDDTAEDYDGLLLLAAYATARDDLSDTSLEATDITAEHDRVLNGRNHEEGRSRLPRGTVFEWIQGGNHAQFGDYGEQPGDSPARLNAAEQRAETVTITLDLMRRAAAD